ncbi:MAG TPA: PIN domain-containing protein [Terriglobales bacterium]|nr:PIN domain-containing protein [Terriglobales bacterium]
MKPVLLDTGVIVALLDRSERFHQTSVEVLRDLTAPLVTCEAVIAESCYLLRGLKGAGEAVVENVVSGVFQIPVPLGQSAGEIRDIMRKYRDRQIDFADAGLICLANYFGTGKILTLDGDFEVYRWGRNKPFELLIPLH